MKGPPFLPFKYLGGAWPRWRRERTCLSELRRPGPRKQPCDPGERGPGGSGGSSRLRRAGGCTEELGDARCSERWRRSAARPGPVLGAGERGAPGAGPRGGPGLVAMRPRVQLRQEPQTWLGRHCAVSCGGSLTPSGAPATIRGWRARFAWASGQMKAPGEAADGPWYSRGTPALERGDLVGTTALGR
ncbi:hypothetical protein NDU88_004772 [Pleurodeles waltl]|uniref:Uncharacterized protein n=1 Tax=Pleurodeles waltl TaxID=8319 RepID=A0AAV7SJS0_PLEWA|nr:hypothetical protein NDU88_004772 [Pleurodeles waltl]